MKNFVKFLVLAQAASDAGKGKNQNSANACKAVLKGYSLKDQYILQAIVAAKKLSGVKVSRNYDERLGMEVVYFDIDNFGQVSFHTPNPKLYKKLPATGVWSEKREESATVCKRLAKRYKLQHYR